jgi:hypothetical protein
MHDNMLEAFLQIVHEQESLNEGFQDLSHLEKEAHKQDESSGEDSTFREDCMDYLLCLDTRAAAKKSSFDPIFKPVL